MVCRQAFYTVNVYCHHLYCKGKQTIIVNVDRYKCISSFVPELSVVGRCLSETGAAALQPVVATRGSRTDSTSRRSRYQRACSAVTSEGR